MLRGEHILFAPIFAQPFGLFDPKELNQSTLAPDFLILLSDVIGEPTLRRRGVRASISSTSELPLPRQGGESIAAGDPGNIGPNSEAKSSSTSARLFVVVTVDVKAADTPKARDEAGMSESSDGPRMRSYSPWSSYVLNLVGATKEAGEVASLPFPPNVFIVFIDIFEPIEPIVSRISFAWEFRATSLLMFADAPAGYGTMSGTLGKTLGLKVTVFVVLPSLKLVAALDSPPAERGLPSLISTSSLIIRSLVFPFVPYVFLYSHIHPDIPIHTLGAILLSALPHVCDSCSTPT
jgi:hypothetical protein